MDKAAALEAVARLRAGMEARGVKLQKIILYGSFASRSQREGSDIDLVLISEDFSDMSYWQRIEVVSDAIYEIFVPVEAVPMTPEEWERGDSFVVDFARDGEVVYAA